MAHQADQPPHNDVYSVADLDISQNRAAQALMHEAGHNRKIVGVPKGKMLSQEELERIVAEEKEKKSKFPLYAGLERWRLLEKMGDGAFSNVYRAVDTEGTVGEVAIKVVRKFEMNSTQVSTGSEHQLSFEVISILSQPWCVIGRCLSSSGF
jgi:serine/threonine-protein kinase RCK2